MLVVPAVVLGVVLVVGTFGQWLGDRQAVANAERQRAAQASPRVSDAPETPPDELSQLRHALAAASAEMGRLQTELENRAAVIAGQSATIEELNAKLRTITTEPDGQFRRLRALIVKEFHPDHAPEGSVDRAIRAEVFKTIWPKIEAITGHA